MPLERNEADLFAAVLEVAESERPAFLQQACGDDLELRARLERYLRAHQAENGPLDASPADMTSLLSNFIADCRVGTRVGPYKLLEQIGSGGMGVVFMVEQREPVKRTVALKIIKPGMDSQQVIARFEAERQALALMNHPNIAKVLDAGTTESGLPYFAMELVKGIPITEYCDEHRFDTRQRLELFILICRAVQHAHLKGIIHRDLKPTNVLVELHDVHPVPKVIDFGVAKAINQSLTDRSLYTGFSQMIGTPAYMSPEQAQLSGLDVDTRSDVYSLGVILYELLVGDTPFDRETLRQASFDEMRRMIREDDPPRPSDKIITLVAERATTVSSRRKTDRRSLSATVRNELDWIVMKALEKDRTRRYESASALAVDVKRYLDGESVQACPPTLSYRTRKTLSRHKGILTTAGLLIGTMIVGSSLAVWQATAARSETVRANAAQERAQEAADAALLAKQAESIQRQIAQHALYVSDTRLAASQVRAGEYSNAFNSLMNQFPTSPEENSRGWEWYYLLSQANQAKLSWYASSQDVRSIDWSPDGKRIATAANDGTATIWNATNGNQIRQFGNGNHKRSVAWHPNGSMLAWGSTADEALVRIWDEATNGIIELHDNSSSIWTIRWNHAGDAFVAGAIPEIDPNEPPIDHNLMLWKRLDGHWTVTARALLPWNITSVEWSFDDRLISVAGDATLPSKILDGETLSVASTYEKRGRTSDWHPTRNLLASGLNSGKCAIFDFDSSTEVMRFEAHLGRVFDVQWSDDGQMLATCSEPGSVKIWNAADWSLLASYAGHDGIANEVTWRPDSKELASVGSDGIVHIWPVEPTASLYEIESSEGVHCAWTVDGMIRTLMQHNTLVDRSVAAGEVVRSIDLPPGQGNWELAGKNLTVREHRDGEQLKFDIAVIGSSNTIARTEFTVDAVAASASMGMNYAANRDGTKLATVSRADGRPALHDWVDRVVRELDSATHPFSPQICWSPDEKWLGVVGHGRREGFSDLWGSWLHLYDVEAATHVASMRLDSQEKARACAWSPDSTRVVASGGLGICAIFDLTSFDGHHFARVLSKRIHPVKVNSLSWHPDGSRIASGGDDVTVNVWDSSTGDILLRLPVEGSITHLEWSPDGRMLAAMAAGKIRIWDATSSYGFADAKFILETANRRIRNAEPSR